MSKTRILVAALQNAYEQRIDKLEIAISELQRDAYQERKSLQNEVLDYRNQNRDLEATCSSYKSVISDLKNEIKSLRDQLEPRSLLDDFEAVKSPDPITEADFQQQGFILTVESTHCNNMTEWVPRLASVVRTLLRNEKFKTTYDMQRQVTDVEFEQLQTANIKIVTR